MKKVLLATGLAILFLQVSCEYCFVLSVKNNSNKKIIGFLQEEYIAGNDTILALSMDTDVVNYIIRYYLTSPQKKNKCFELCSHNENISLRSYWGDDIDTLHLFILDADSLQTYGWEECVRRGNMFLQRYDLSIDALENGTSPSLSYPPTPEMGRYIKMWPPYNFDE